MEDAPAPVPPEAAVVELLAVELPPPAELRRESMLAGIENTAVDASNVSRCELHGMVQHAPSAVCPSWKDSACMLAVK